MILTRRRALAALPLAGASLFGTPLVLSGSAWAQKAPAAADFAPASPLGDIVLGSDKAPVTIIEFASMTCSHCANFATVTFPKLKTAFIDTGKVRYIFREFPLDDLAAATAVLARCAGKADGTRTFAMIETLFASQKDWVVQQPLQPLKNIAKQVGIGEQAFEACFADKALLEGVKANQQQGIKLGVNSTPTFFINGTMHRGDLGFEEIEKVLKPMLGE
ncbi:MAG: DsbA family protein [Xanthobacteraceae bacterium]|nr:MAG: DsbA family protein [Xanthobacteraceae bacterium]